MTCVTPSPALFRIVPVGSLTTAGAMPQQPIRSSSPCRSSSPAFSIRAWSSSSTFPLVSVPVAPCSTRSVRVWSSVCWPPASARPAPPAVTLVVPPPCWRPPVQRKSVVTSAPSPSTTPAVCRSAAIRSSPPAIRRPLPLRLSVPAPSDSRVPSTSRSPNVTPSAPSRRRPATRASVDPRLTSALARMQTSSSLVGWRSGAQLALSRQAPVPAPPSHSIVHGSAAGEADPAVSDASTAARRATGRRMRDIAIEETAVAPCRQSAARGERSGDRRGAHPDTDSLGARKT